MKLVEYNGLICIVISSCNIWSDGVTALRLERVDGRPMCYGPDYYRINNTAHAEDAPDWQIHVDRSAVHHIDPLAAAMYEHEKKISLKNKGRHRPKTSCPHCDTLADKGNYKRWHGDNCKHKGNK